MFKLTTKSEADSFFYSLSHFECDGHTVHMLTQCLPPPLTSTVRLSLFMHVHSSPLSPCLPGYTDVAQTILITLMMAGLFMDRPDKPCIYSLVVDDSYIY